MKEIRLEQFDSAQDMILFFNDLVNVKASPGFFWGKDEVDFWAQEMKKENIRIFQYDYLRPFNDGLAEGEEDLELSQQRKDFLNQRGKRKIENRKIAESVLMFLNPLFTELQMASQNTWIDLVSKSGIFIGTFTFEKFHKILLSQWGENIGTIYVFPWRRSEFFSAPFGMEIFLKMDIGPECREDFRRRERDMLAEAAKKCQVLIEMPKHLQ